MRGAEFVLAPELFLCGYPPRDLLLRADFVETNLGILAETAKGVGKVPLCVGYVDQNPERPGRALRNSAPVGRGLRMSTKMSTFALLIRP